MSRLSGVICKSTGSWYELREASGQAWQCRIRGKFRLAEEGLSNPLAVGDEVYFEPEGEEGTGIITELKPRRNYVLRQSPQNRRQLHMLAANIDQALLVLTMRQPRLKLNFIDRFLLTVEGYRIPTILLINKADTHDEDDEAMYLGFKTLYEGIGYTCLQVSAQEGLGIEALRDLVKGKRSLVSGQSGVGKSSLLNAVQPGLGLRTGEISDYSGKGKHTTTFAEMFDLPELQAQIIDSPGIKELAFIHLSPQDLAHNFREFFERSAQCKYGNCLHVDEPGCAVKAGIESGELSELRYQSYLSILADIKGQNHWEQRRDW